MGISRRVKKRKGKERRVLGIDQSLDHSALVLLGSGGGKSRTLPGHLLDFRYFVDTKTDLKAYKEALMVPAPDGKVNDTYKLERLLYLRKTFKQLILEWQPDIAAMEGYAYNAKGSSAMQTGELVGMLRMLLRDLHVPFFIFDPGSIKLYGAGKAGANKVAMVMSCSKRWERINFAEYGNNCDNIADAYIIAQLLWELDCVREGDLTVNDLRVQTKRVLQRTTKPYPESLITVEPL